VILMTEINNLKLSITGTIDFIELETVVHAVINRGYTCLAVDNGNFVFEKK
jgi:hypothetical protein